MEETFIWSHEPQLSSEPVERILHDLRNNDDEVDESALFRLSDGGYLCIKFKGLKTDTAFGITELEEFETIDEAKEFYEENYQE